MSKTQETTLTVESEIELEQEIEQIQSQNKRYLRPKEILAFCIVNFASQNYNEFINSNLQYFLIQFMGIDSTAYANINLLTSAYDAVDDTLSGLIIDRTRTRWGRVKPYLILPLPLWFISTMMLFSVPNFGQTGNLIWTISAIILRGLGMSYFGAWYLLLYNNTPNQKERNNLITTSEFAKLFGTWIISLIPVFLDIGRKTGISETSIFSFFAFLCCVILAVACIFGFRNMRERIPLQSREEMNEVGIIESFKQLFKNRPMFVLVLANFCNSFKSVGGSNEKFFWFNCTGKYSHATITGLFTGIPNYFMTPLTGKLINKYGARKTIITACLFGGFAYTAMWLIGYHPFGETFESNTVANMIYIITALTICGLPNCIIKVCLPSLTGDMYDYTEWKCGVRNEGLVNTISNYFLKFGYAVNGWLAGMVLTMIKYEPLVDDAGNAIPNTDPGVMRGLWIIFALAPAFARFATGISFLFFNVHGKFKEQMLIDLEERRNVRLKAISEDQPKAETQE